MIQNLTDRQKWGLIFLASVAILTLIWYLFIRDTSGDCADCPDSITITGYSGNLKVPYLENPEVREILKDRYNLVVDNEGWSTGRMLCSVDLEGADYLWIGDMSQVPVYDECRNRSGDRARETFFSPVVLYSWVESTNALIDAGAVELGDDGIYRLDMVALYNIIHDEQSWTDLGISSRPGSVLIRTTDPAASTSGQHFAALLANTMVCTDTVTSSNVDSTLNPTYRYFERLGLMPTSSATLWDEYITIGEAAFQLVALYESQLAGYLLDNPDFADRVRTEMRMLYPEPTVWINHPVIALTEGGRRFQDALRDPDLQRLGWDLRGFRPWVSDVEIDLSVVPIPIPNSLDFALQIPAYPVMQEVLKAAALEENMSPGNNPNRPPLPVCDDTNTSTADPPETPSPQAQLHREIAFLYGG